MITPNWSELPWKTVPYDPHRSMNERTEAWVRSYLPDDWVEISRSILGLDQGEEKAQEGLIFVPTPMVFKDGEPTCFWPNEGGTPFRGQERVKDWLHVVIETLEEEERFKRLVVGMAGIGKTALCWIIAKYLIDRRGGRFFEILPSQIETVDALGNLLKQLQPQDVVFMDEVHQIAEGIGGEPLFHVLGDTGESRFKYKGEQWIIPPNVHWLAATTDYGEMDSTTGGALIRRMEPVTRLDPPTTEDLVAIIGDRYEVEDAAALEVAERSNGLPWQALLIIKEAQYKKRYDRATEIEFEHVMWAFDKLGIDANGLNPDDRAVMSILLGAPDFKMAKSGLCQISGVDPKTFEKRVQPKLLKMGLIRVRGGMMLTEKALEGYATGMILP